MSKLREGERLARKPSRPEWLGSRYPWTSGSYGFWRMLIHAGEIAPEETMPPRWYTALGWIALLLFPILIVGANTQSERDSLIELSNAIRLFPIITFFNIVATYLGKFYAERLGLNSRYGPYAQEQGQERGALSWLHPRLLNFWARSRAEHVPPLRILNIFWFSGLVLSVALFAFQILPGGFFGGAVTPIVYLFASGLGKSNSERQMMDEIYDY